MLAREHAGKRVLIVAHQVVVNCMRYLVEEMDEAQILGIDRKGDIPNCSITSYRATRSVEGTTRLDLDLLNFMAPLEQTGTPVTLEADASTAAKP